MAVSNLQKKLGNIDLYLLDQVLKNRISKSNSILDAGCGSARNMHYFISNGYQITGIDSDKDQIEKNRKKYAATNFDLGTLTNLPYKKNTFDYVICNAVLHFSTSENQLFKMLDELFRVLKTEGTLFIRMTSNFGIEDNVNLIKDGVYKIPDGSTRFLLTISILEKLKSRYNITFIEPMKTVNVSNKRCMTNLVLRKNK
ncbi:MAG: class I SAM-dependent methyltransferase [Flavobacteriaceae bacterium]